MHSPVLPYIAHLKIYRYTFLLKAYPKQHTLYGIPHTRMGQYTHMGQNNNNNNNNKWAFLCRTALQACCLSVDPSVAQHQPSASGAIDGAKK